MFDKMVFLNIGSKLYVFCFLVVIIFFPLKLDAQRLSKQISNTVLLTDSEGIFCNGVLIDSVNILTAAHCLARVQVDGSRKPFYSNTYVMLFDIQSNVQGYLRIKAIKVTRDFYYKSLTMFSKPGLDNYIRQDLGLIILEKSIDLQHFDLTPLVNNFIKPNEVDKLELLSSRNLYINIDSTKFEHKQLQMKLFKADGDLIYIGNCFRGMSGSPIYNSGKLVGIFTAEVDMGSSKACIINTLIENGIVDTTFIDKFISVPITGYI
jgi:V8-like Glu-specific endopeptidase